MQSQSSRRETSEPPSLDEAHWNAILLDGEFAHTEPARETPAFDVPTHTHTAAPGIADDWAGIGAIMQHDGVIEAAIVGHNRGGVLVEWGRLRGFVPASQLLHFPNTTNPAQRRRLLEARIGEMLTLRVIELNSSANRLILSERAARAAVGERADILDRLQPGDVITGVVTNLCDFGAFVDLGGLEGLIHISELSWGRVGHPADILMREQTVQVQVLDVRPAAGRVALSIKRLYPDPWATVDQRYHIGEIVEGVVTNVVEFGAFARLEEGLEGLIHVSELAEGHFLHPRNVVEEGQAVRARIISIDGSARRLGLSLRETAAQTPTQPPASG
jgi:small subunit ribosomal protein S1